VKRIRLILCIALLLMLLPLGLVSASPAIHIEGECKPSPAWKYEQTDHANGNKCIVDMGAMFRLTGTQGTTVDVECPAEWRIIVHGPCQPPGAYRQDATIHGVCTGEVAGREGTFELKAAQQFDPGKEYPLQTQCTLKGLTGELSTLHGVVHVSGIPGVGGTYEGVVTFGPDR